MTLPLADKRVLVTRSREQSLALTTRLAELGATPIEIAMIAIEPPSDGGTALSKAVDRLDEYQWVIVTSTNGARALSAALPADAELPPVACVGPSTAHELSSRGWRVDLVPERFVGEGIVDSLVALDEMPGKALLVQAEVARPAVADGLAAHGWLVERVAAYRTGDAEVSDEQRQHAETADIVLFTSSSTVERFVRLVGIDALPNVVGCIGPITAATATDLDVSVDVIAAEHTIDGLVDAVVAYCRERSDT